MSLCDVFSSFFRSRVSELSIHVVLNETAVFVTEPVSAPLEASVSSRCLIKSISGPIGLSFNEFQVSFVFTCLSGMGTNTILSNRPGLNKAEYM